MNISDESSSSSEIMKEEATRDPLFDLDHPNHDDPAVDDSDQEPKITVVPIDKEAPSPDYWYHGRLDRIRSEERLKKSNSPGSFLVRESDRKPGSFVLCYFSYKSTIYHFKITAVLGDYYIGGRQFDRLETLISYYMYYSELVKGEKLVNPIPPPIVCRLERICYSTKPFISKLDSANNNNNNDEPNETTMLGSSTSVFANKHPEDILHFDKVGQLFKVIHQIGESEWLWAQSFESGEFGLLLAECIEFIDDYKLHEIEPWFYLDITKESAASILASAGPLSYLVRPSDHSPDDLTLYFNIDNVIHRYKILCLVDCETDTKFYQIGGRDFSNVSSIVERYMSEEITEGYTLSKIPHVHNETFSIMTQFQKAQQTRLLSEYNSKIESLKPNKTLLNKRDLFKKKSSSFSIESLLNRNVNVGKCTHENGDATFHNNSSSIKRNSVVENGDRQTEGDETPRYNSHYSKIMESVTSSAIELEEKPRSATTTIAYNNSSHMTSFDRENDSVSQQQSTTTTTMDGFGGKTSNNLYKQTDFSCSYGKQQAESKYEPEKSNNNMFNKINLIKATKAKLTRQSSKAEQKANKLPVTKSSSSPLAGSSSKRDYVTKQSPNKGDQFVKDGYLSKFNEKTKKWKLYHFMLYQSEQQLYYFSMNKHLKEKGLIDLSYGYYYPVDDSFFNRPHCFQIVIHSLGNASNNQSDILIHYLSTDSMDIFKDWTEHIRPLCNPAQFSPSFSGHSPSQSVNSEPSPTVFKSQPVDSVDDTFGGDYRVLRTLNLDVHEARNVCFSPLIQTTNNGHNASTSPPQSSTSSSSMTGALPMPPKYHKDNLYYCLVLFNSEAFVASTRFSNTTSTTINVSSYLNNFQQHSNDPLESSYGSNNNGSSSSSSSNSYLNESNCTSRDTIWDDSFSFDNLPLDVRDVKICLFSISKRFNLSASFVNNLKKIGGGGSSSSSAYSNTKMFDPILIGYVNIRLNDLINKGLVEKWYTVEPTVNVESADSAVLPTSTHCTIRIKVRFCEEKIYLNTNCYRLLSDYLMDEEEHKHICTLYEQIVPSSERPHFVHALLRFYIVKNRIVHMLKSYLLTEIDKCADLSTIFRPATLCTSLMDNYMRTRCDEFLARSLQEPLTRILRSDFGASSSPSSVKHAAFNAVSLSKSYSPVSSNLPSPSYAVSANGVVSFELDPTKCPDGQQRDQNLHNFKQALKELITTICSKSSVNLFPNELKHLFWLVKQRVHLKWQEQQQQQQQQHESTGEVEWDGRDDKQIRIYCVSAFVFLRLLCPAMLNAKSFGLKYFNTNNSQPNAGGMNRLNNLTLNGLTLETHHSMANSSSSSSSSTSTSVTCLNGTDSTSSSTPSSSKINYIKLANQFSVFSSSFMFTLPSSNFNTDHCSSSSHHHHNQQQQHLNHQHQLTTALNLNQWSQITNPIVLNNLASAHSTSTHFSLFQTTNPTPIQQATTHERHIKLLAKVLQTLANMTECKESFMLKLSDFLNANRPNLVRFIEDISSLDEFVDSVQCNEEQLFSHASCKYLSILHRLLSSAIPNMRSYLLKLSTSSVKKSSSHSSPASSTSSSASSSRSSSNHSNILSANNSSSMDSEEETINNGDETNSSFEASIHRLITILNDISNKTHS